MPVALDIAGRTDSPIEYTTLRGKIRYTFGASDHAVTVWLLNSDGRILMPDTMTSPFDEFDEPMGFEIDGVTIYPQAGVQPVVMFRVRSGSTRPGDVNTLRKLFGDGTIDYVGRLADQDFRVNNYDPEHPEMNYTFGPDAVAGTATRTFSVSPEAITRINAMLSRVTTDGQLVGLA